MGQAVQARLAWPVLQDASRTCSPASADSDLASVELQSFHQPAPGLQASHCDWRRQRLTSRCAVGDAGLQSESSSSHRTGAAVTCTDLSSQASLQFVAVLTMALAAEIDIHSPKTNRRSAGFTEACSGSKAAACIMAELSLQLQALTHMLCAASRSVLAHAASHWRNAVLDSEWLLPAWQALAPVCHL